MSMPLALITARPTHASHVGNRIGARQEFAICEALVHHPEKPMRLITVALHRIRELLGRIVAEMIVLAEHGTEPAHLPHQPLLDLDAATLILGIELSGLATEVKQNGARLEYRDRSTVRTFGIDDRRHAVVGRDCEKFRVELIALPDIDEMQLVREPAFLEHDRDLPPVRRGPIIKLDRFGLRHLALLPSLPRCVSKNRAASRTIPAVDKLEPDDTLVKPSRSRGYFES